MIGVLVADDHPLYREALAAAVAKHDQFELVGQAVDGQEALEMATQLNPDIAVLDVRMPGLSGLEVASTLKRDGSATRVILLSGYAEPALIYDAIATGVGAYFSKVAEAAEICEAIISVSNGATVLPSEVQTSIAQQIRLRADSGQQQLTAREREILQLTAAGHSGPQIARDLGLSAGTVKTHLRHVYEKLGVSGRAAAVAEAMRAGIIQSPRRFA